MGYFDETDHDLADRQTVRGISVVIVIGVLVLVVNGAPGWITATAALSSFVVLGWFLRRRARRR